MIQPIKKIIKKFLPTNRIDLWRFERSLWDEMYPSMLEEGMANCECNDFKDKKQLFIHDLKRYHVSFNEWAILYDFPHLNSFEKSKFLSRYDAWSEYRKFITPQIRELFYNKIEFLNHFKSHINRQFLAPPDVITDDFLKELELMTSSYDLIVKPLKGSLGSGVYKLNKDSIDNVKHFAEEITQKALLVEECISGNSDIQRFNPQSLNTIRIITTFDGRIFDSFTRFGNGNSVVDNAHNGGIWCMNDINKGVICTDGVNSEGQIFEKHPVTGYTFKNTILPKWDECCEKVISMHRGMDLPFIGWDVCVNSKGQIEIIEANHAPDIDLLQYPSRIGIKSKFMDVIVRFRKYLIDSGKISDYPWAKY